MTAPNPDPFTGEIRIFPFNHAPKGWVECNGQLMSITENTALYSIIGTTYGGDGKSTFALPNLQGSVPAGPGQGRGLSPYSLGGVAGSETVTLTWAEMPSHNHQVAAQTIDQGDNRIPTADLHLGNTELYSDASVATATLDSTVVANAGESRPHNNLMPYLTFNFCIAVQGIFPARN